MLWETWYEKILPISLGGFRCFSCISKTKLGRKSLTNYLQCLIISVLFCRTAYDEKMHRLQAEKNVLHCWNDVLSPVNNKINKYAVEPINVMSLVCSHFVPVALFYWILKAWIAASSEEQNDSQWLKSHNPQPKPSWNKKQGCQGSSEGPDVERVQCLFLLL